MNKNMNRPLAEADPEVAQAIANEERRQHEKIRLIPSENYASKAVLEATGSVLTNKYSEGYAGKRYYEGQQIVDLVENLAVERVKKLFGVDHVNVEAQVTYEDGRVGMMRADVRIAEAEVVGAGTAR